jgi:3-oxoacyl-[acyl-carrier protein] reductase
MAGRVAVVTGAGGGIGSATCRKLAEAGASVVLTYRQSEEQTRAVMESLPGDGHTVLQVDVADSAAVYRTVLALATLLTFSTGSMITVDGGRLLI